MPWKTNKCGFVEKVEIIEEYVDASYMMNLGSIAEIINDTGDLKNMPQKHLEHHLLTASATVDGNKVTLDFSAENPACRKVDMYMFQDKDDTQLHIYMPAKSFINYFANLEILTIQQISAHQ